MSYVKVKWIHQNKNCPHTIYSQLDCDSYEIRKIEIFQDKIGFAADKLEYGETKLGIVPVPTIDEINQSSEFLAEEISEKEFNQIWNHIYQLMHIKNREKTR